MILSKHVRAVFIGLALASAAVARTEWPMTIDELCKHADVICSASFEMDVLDRHPSRSSRLAADSVGYPTSAELWVHYVVLRPEKVMKGRVARSLLLREVHPAAGGCNLDTLKARLEKRPG